MEGSEIKKIWKRFCNESTFGGLHFVAGFGYKNKFINFLWALLFCLCSGLLIYSVGDISVRYLRFDVNTKSYYELDEEVDFPAITICNENEFRKSILGGSNTAMVAMAAVFGKKETSMMDMIKQNNRTCFNSVEGPQAKEFDSLGVSYFIVKGLAEGMRVSATDSFSSTLKCWWNSVEMECNGQFFNHYTDYGWCFTFNPSADLVGAKDHRSVIEGYGWNVTMHLETKTLINAGRKNGFRILLNVNQSDYCGAIRKYKGAGFLMQVHDPRSMPTYQFRPYVSLAPGFDYNIVLEPIEWRKKTENLGMCSPSVDSLLHPESKIYLQMDCFLECFNMYVMKECDCLPIQMSGSKFTNSKNKTLEPCWGSAGSACVTKIFNMLIEHGLKSTCQRCKDPCVVREFKLGLSVQKFPPNRMLRSYNDIQIKPNELQNNVLLVNFYFKDVVIEVIEEYQSISNLDFFISIGAKTTLFLGMSMISFGEVLLQLLLTVDLTIKIVMKKLSRAFCRGKKKPKPNVVKYKDSRKPYDKTINRHKVHPLGTLTQSNSNKLYSPTLF